MELDDEYSLLRIVKERYRTAVDQSGEWREEAEEDYDFVAGDQWDDEDRAKLEEQLRPIITFNRTGPIIEAVSGSEINNRQEVKFVPRTEGDVEVNELLTGAAHWVRDMCNAEDEESTAFWDMVVCGMGWTETRLDYDEDPDGRIEIERVDPLEMYWDPAACKQNLSDARYVMRIKDVSRREFRVMWPHVDISQNTNWLAVTGPEDFGEPHLASEAFKYENDQSWRYDGNREGKNKYRVVEYQWWQYEEYYRVLNPLTGQIEELEPEQYERIEERVEQYGLPKVKQRRRVYYRAFLAGDTVLEVGTNPCENDFTYKCMTGKLDRNKNTFYGIVRALKDPQRWANKFFSQILHIINSNAKGGLLAEEGAFVNPHKAEDEWARPDSITMLTDGALSNNKVQEKSVGKYPMGIDRMMDFAITSMRDVTGVNLEMLGLAGRTQAGVLEEQRKQSGMTILAPLFNSLKRYRKEQGRVLLYFIREYISDGRLIRINGKQGQQYVPLTNQDETYEYDVIVDDAPTSPNQKEQVWSMLMQMMPMIQKAGVPMPPDMLDYLPLPSTLIDKWKRYISSQMEQQKPQQQLMMQQAQVEMAKTQAEAQKTSAEAQRAQADTQNRMAEIPKIEAETFGTYASAQLDQAKARSEMANSPDSELERWKAMQEAQRQDEELITKQIEMLLKRRTEREKVLQDIMSTMNNQQLADDRARRQQDDQFIRSMSDSEANREKNSVTAIMSGFAEMLKDQRERESDVRKQQTEIAKEEIKADAQRRENPSE